MTRRSWLGRALAAAAATTLLPASLVGCARREAGQSSPPTVQKSAAEWRELLTPEQYDVLFRERTERPHSSPLNGETREGQYLCAACFLPLFTSETKYESGTGWPSFWAPIDGSMGTKPDYTLFMRRTEYHCIRCHGHQGHVFDDGPPPTGQRWCNNGVALEFVPAGEDLPELRS